MSELENIELELIRIDGGTQSRAELNEDTVAEYAQSLRDGAVFPPVTVYLDGGTFWLAEGFHRYHAHRSAGVAAIPCAVTIGTRREAVLFSVGANAAHGLRRTNADKRRAVLTLLDDPEWGAWSDREIARQCGVSQPFVGEVRRSILKPLSDAAPGAPIPGMSQDGPATRTVTRGGVTYQQNTAAIGKAGKAPAVDGPRDASLHAEEMDPVADQGAAPVTSFSPGGTPGAVAADPVADQKTPPRPGSGPLVADLVADRAADDAADPAPDPAAAGALAALRAELAERDEHIAELSRTLRETLADNEMMGRVFDADDRMAAMMTEARRQAALAENAERTLRAKNGEYIERARAVTYWQNRAQKAEKALARLASAK